MMFSVLFLRYHYVLDVLGASIIVLGSKDAVFHSHCEGLAVTGLENFDDQEESKDLIPI